jgi:hypothetical protein
LNYPAVLQRLGALLQHANPASDESLTVTLEQKQAFLTITLKQFLAKCTVTLKQKQVFLTVTLEQFLDKYTVTLEQKQYLCSVK